MERHYIVVEELFSSNPTSSKVLIAVSKDDGANWGSDRSLFNADWNFFSIDTAIKVGNKPTAIDFPQIATDGVNLFISGDQFAPNSYVGNSLTTIPLSVLEASNPGTSSLSYTPLPTGLKLTMEAVSDPAGGCYLIGYDGMSNAEGEYVTVSHSGSSAPPYQIPVGIIDDLSVTTLVATEIGGQLIDASDRRVIDAKLVGGELFAVAEVAPPGGGDTTSALV